MKKYLFPLLSLMVLTSCGTSQVLKDDISTLTSKVYHLESQNKELAEKVEKLTQRVAIQESSLKSVSQELNSVKIELKNQMEAPIAIPPQVSTTHSNGSSSTKSSSTKNTSTRSHSSTVSKSTSTYSGRCQATTKKGTQCKRMAQAGRNYCWQH